MNTPSRLLALAVASLFATAAVAQYAPPPPPPPPPATVQGAMPPPPPPPPAAPVAPTAPAEQQSLPEPPPPPPPPAPPAAPQPYQPMSAPASTGGMSEEHSVQFQNPQGATVTVNYGMPEAAQYGPKPPFAQLDANHDGRISQSEAQAYLPLYNDWLHVAPHASSISKAQYNAWND